jgi:PLP dependent protein
MDPIQLAVQQVTTRVGEAARACGRDPQEITIVAASKTRTVEEIRRAADCGIKIFGENRVQEWLSKKEGLEVQWHLIGALQRNKVNKVVGAIGLLHAIDSVEIAEAVSRQAVKIGVVQDILLAVNTSREPTKHGVALSTAVEVSERVAELPGVTLRGYSTVASVEDPGECFGKLAELRDRTPVSTAQELSMGMSADLEPAIQAGATLVRPGTALFGPRLQMP